MTRVTDLENKTIHPEPPVPLWSFVKHLENTSCEELLNRGREAAGLKGSAHVEFGMNSVMEVKS